MLLLDLAALLRILNTLSRTWGLDNSCDWTLPTWRKVSLPGLIALLKRALASSLVRISRALLMPANSSVRARTRSDHSAAFVAQIFFVWSKRATDASMASFVSSSSWDASARIFSASAFSISFLVLVAVSTDISLAFTLETASKFFDCVASSSVLFSRFMEKVSYMSLRMPWIVADCGENDELFFAFSSRYSAAAGSRVKVIRADIALGLNWWFAGSRVIAVCTISPTLRSSIWFFGA